MKTKKNTTEKCEHKYFRRHWYDENHLINVCCECSYEWEEKYRPFLLEDWGDLTSGIHETTAKDIEIINKFKAKK